MAEAVPESDLPGSAVPESDLPSAPGGKEEKTSLVSRALAPIKSIPHEIAKEWRQGSKTIGDGDAEYNAAIAEKRTPSLGAPLQVMSGAAQKLFAPVTGTAKALLGNPMQNLTEAATGNETAGRFAGQLGTDVGSMFGPGIVSKSMSRMADALPEFSQSVKTLMDAGIKLTPGMIWQGAVRNAEKFLGDVPLVSNLVKNGQRESLDSFNRVMWDKSLEPLGLRLPKDISAGREAAEWVAGKYGGAYDKLLPKLNFQVTGEFLNDANAIKAKASTLPESTQKQLAAIGDDVVSRIPAGGVMPGRVYKQVESELGYAARGYLKSQDPDQKRLGSLINELRGAMMDNLERTNPKFVGQLRDINSGWAAYSRLQDASIRRATSGGIFSPNDLLQTIKGQTSKGVFARGDGLYQDLAEAAAEVLPSSVPEGLGVVGHGIGAGLLGGALHLEPGLAATAAIGALPYTKPGLEAVRRFAGRTPGASGPLVGDVGMAAPAVASLPDGYTYRQAQALEGGHTRRPGRPTLSGTSVPEAADAVMEDAQ